MPSFKQHCAISRDRNRGFDFAELHKWIDAPRATMGMDHRLERHALNTKDMNFIRSYWNGKKGPGWGDKAVVEWLFHIALDNLSTAFKQSHRVYGDRTYNYLAFGFAENNFIHIDFDTLDEDELEEEFEGSGEEDDE